MLLRRKKLNIAFNNLKKKKSYLRKNVICNKGIITHNKVKLYSQTATFIEEAERIKKSAEEKEGYGKLSNLSTKI